MAARVRVILGAALRCRRGLLLAMLTLVLGVGPVSQPSLGQGREKGSTRKGATEPPLDTNQLLAMVGREVGSFGGHYLDSDGRLHVWLTNPDTDDALKVKALLINIVDQDLGDLAKGIVVEKAAFQFVQLNEWYDSLLNVQQVAPSLVFTDIDDRRNRILLGVEEAESARPAIEAELSRLEIPLDAVLIEEATPVMPTLLDRHRPLVGGLQIQYQTGAFGLGTGTCTLGFNARKGSTKGFVTNSHCSRTQGEIDNGRYWQPTRPASDGDQIGAEILDAPFFTGGTCPAGRRCRYSDSNFVQRASDQTAQQKVARPPLNSTSYNGSSTFRITEKASGNPTVAVVLTKVGLSTGRTAGQVTSSCVRTDVGMSDITLLCQSVMAAAVDFGDSGSPVFRIINSPLNNDVRLMGIVWGKVNNDTIYYSQMNWLQTEVGALDVCVSGLSCP